MIIRNCDCGGDMNECVVIHKFTGRLETDPKVLQCIECGRETEEYTDTDDAMARWNRGELRLKVKR